MLNGFDNFGQYYRDELSAEGISTCKEILDKNASLQRWMVEIMLNVRISTSKEVLNKHL